MKFGLHLKEKVKSDWRFYYIDYDGLKKMIKDRTSTGGFFEESDEANFVEHLEQEIQKVLDFRDVKVGELTRHVQYCEEQMKGDILKEDDRRIELEAEINRVTDELADLSTFTRINYTFFYGLPATGAPTTHVLIPARISVQDQSKLPYVEIVITETLDDGAGVKVRKVKAKASTSGIKLGSLFER